MKQKKMLVLTFSQLKQIYTQEMPELVEMAAVSPTVEDFKAGLLKHLDSCGMVNEVAEEAREQIRLLLQYDGQDVHELSTGQDISGTDDTVALSVSDREVGEYRDADGFVSRIVPVVQTFARGKCSFAVSAAHQEPE